MKIGCILSPDMNDQDIAVSTHILDLIHNYQFSSSVDLHLGLTSKQANSNLYFEACDFKKKNVRIIEWKNYFGHELNELFSTNVYSDLKYTVPDDGGYSFAECDFWLVIGSAFNSAILAPLQPYSVINWYSDFPKNLEHLKASEAGKELISDVDSEDRISRLKKQSKLRSSAAINYSFCLRNSSQIYTFTNSNINWLLQHVGVPSEKVIKVDYANNTEIAEPDHPSGERLFQSPCVFVDIDPDTISPALCVNALKIIWNYLQDVDSSLSVVIGSIIDNTTIVDAPGYLEKVEEILDSEKQQGLLPAIKELAKQTKKEFEILGYVPFSQTQGYFSDIKIILNASNSEFLLSRISSKYEIHIISDVSCSTLSGEIDRIKQHEFKDVLTVSNHLKDDAGLDNISSSLGQYSNDLYQKLDEYFLNSSF